MYEEKRIEQGKRIYFPDHVAKADSDEHMIQWKKPGTGNNSVVYLLHRNLLFVGGDLGSAVYCWSQCITLDFLAGCNLDYFAGKCEASEVGRSFNEWDGDTAERRMRERFAEEGYYAEGTRTKFEAAGGWGFLYSRDEWHMWMSGDGDSVFGEQYYELGIVGERLNGRCILHWLGIVLATKQLRAVGQQAAP